MRQTTLTQSGAPRRVIDSTSLSYYHSVHGFRRKFQCFTGFVYCLFTRLVSVELPLRENAVTAHVMQQFDWTIAEV